MTPVVAERFNLAEHFLDRHLDEGRAGKVAVHCEGRRLTYADLAADVNRAANAMRSLGAGAGERVLLVLPDSPEFVVAWFAALKIGAIAVPTSTAARAADYEYFLRESEARLIVVDPAVRPMIAPRHGQSVVETTAWSDWLARQSAVFRAHATHRDDPAFWLWTSGSTGNPKAAVHRHRDWVYCCEHYARGVLGIVEDDVTFSPSKLFHAYGLGNGLMFPFHAGASTVLYPGRPAARAVLERAQQSRATLFFSVPTLYAAMLRESDRFDLASVRHGVSAAEPLPAPICRRWRERFGFDLLDGIGSTEALHIYASSRAGAVRPGSVGTAVPGYEIRLNAEGDLWVRGESVALGYHNRPELTAERFRDGWFATGDKFTQDADGCLWYSGRSDDMFRVSGEWVSPIEVESALVEHPAVVEAAVTPYREESGILRPMAYVVVQGEASPALASALQEHVKSRIAGFKSPRRIEFVAELPKTASGKLQRFKLRTA